MELNSETVQALLIECLYRDEEVPGGKAPANAIIVEGILTNFAFHPDRLEQARPTVKGWISLLPDQFIAGKGGGWTFLNLCEDRNGRQWTSLHRTQEEFFVLASGLGLAKFAMPREMWGLLPGGMPYIVFRDDN